MAGRQDVAVVLSGGSVNGVLMELGFLKRLRESELWPRVGWIFGTSAGALSGSMAVLERLDDLQRFMLALQPADAFRPNRLWRLPLLGVHEYALPRTIAERIGDLTELATALARAERELIVFATDATPGDGGPDVRDYELMYSSRRTPPEELAQAIMASAAISALVLPVRVGDRIATDGAWVRNFPLGHAHARPGVRMIVAFRYLPRYPHFGSEGLARMRRRLERFPRIPPVRALIAELREAEERDRRGEPAHLPEMILRLSAAAVVRNTVVEELRVAERDQSIRELTRLRGDVARLVTRHVRNRKERAELLLALDERFATARFPFRHDRAIPRITVRGSVSEVSLEPGFRDQKPWTDEAKLALIARGYELADRELRAAGLDEEPRAETAAG
jgi:predicted acylesterase/phospholipase RssA